MIPNCAVNKTLKKWIDIIKLGDIAIRLQNWSFYSSVELDNTREGTQRKTTTDLERRDIEDFERKRN